MRLPFGSMGSGARPSPLCLCLSCGCGPHVATVLLAGTAVGTVTEDKFELVKRGTGCGSWEYLSRKEELADKRYTPSACAAECLKRSWCTHFYVLIDELRTCSLVPNECTEASWTNFDHYALARGQCAHTHILKTGALLGHGLLVCDESTLFVTPIGDPRASCNTMICQSQRRRLNYPHPAAIYPQAPAVPSFLEAEWVVSRRSLQRWTQRKRARQMC